MLAFGRFQVGIDFVFSIEIRYVAVHISVGFGVFHRIYLSSAYCDVRFLIKQIGNASTQLPSLLTWSIVKAANRRWRWTVEGLLRSGIQWQLEVDKNLHIFRWIQ